jgi:hypothetical protein
MTADGSLSFVDTVNGGLGKRARWVLLMLLLFVVVLFVVALGLVAACQVSRTHMGGVSKQGKVCAGVWQPPDVVGLVHSIPGGTLARRLTAACHLWIQ